MVRIYWIMILSFAAGFLARSVIKLVRDGKPKPVFGGVLAIRKNNEAADGQILFQKGLFELSEAKEVIFKVKIVPGEPGEERE